jgi:hypothetical protein
MPVTFGRAFLAVVMSLLLISGCSSSSDDPKPKPATMPKSSQYYRVLDILDAGNNELYLGTQQGLMLSSESGGSVATIKKYDKTSNPSIGDNVVHSIARNADGNLLAIATNKGLTIGVLDGDGFILSTSIMTKSSNPELGRNDNFVDVVFIGDAVIATVYHIGVVIGKVKADGRVSKFKVYTRETTPRLVSRAVTKLAVNSNQNTVLIGSVGGGLSIAGYNEQTQSFDTIENVGKNVIGNPTVDDIAVNKVNDLVVLGTRDGLSIAKFNEGNLIFLKNYDSDDLNILQCHRIAFAKSGEKIALGVGHTVAVVNIDPAGTLSNLKTYPTDTVLSLIFGEDDTYILVGTDSSQSNKIDTIEL